MGDDFARRCQESTPGSANAGGDVYSIECDYCGEQVVAPRNHSDARSREVATVCIDCNTEWVFIYDDIGECVDCRRAKPEQTRAPPRDR
jgi:hypothetical protein